MLLILDGDPMPKVLMTVIRFCLTTDHHELKKVLMLFWEIVPKYGPDGKLLPEMILVCNALRNDLNHSNEFVRGSMLRLLCKLREPEIIEPLLPSIKACLEHRHSYVRKHAALSLYHIHKNFGTHFLPDGAELVENFISVESELGSRRNAFLMLIQEAEETAIDFLRTNANELDRFGDGFALLVLELTRKVCRRDPAQKAQFVVFLFQLLGSKSAAVSYETAWTLASLSSAPTAIRAAASTYTTLLCSQSDNNVKLIVLERLAEMKQRHPRVLSEILMDILRALASPNIDICKRTLEITIDLVSSRTIDEVMQLLKREVVRTRSSDMERGAEYRALLVDSIHTCASKFPDVAESVAHVLMDFLDAEGAIDVVLFVRSIVQQYPNLRSSILEKLLVTFPYVQAGSVLATTLWILGEYVESELIDEAFEAIMQGIGGTVVDPLGEVATGGQDDSSAVEAGAAEATKSNKTVVLADGTYASAAEVGPAAKKASVAATSDSLQLRRLLLHGDIYLGTIAAGALAKLTCKTIERDGPKATLSKRRQCATVAFCCSLGKFAEARSPSPSAGDGLLVNGLAASGQGSNGAAPVSNAHPQDGDDSAVADSLERLEFLTHVLLSPAYDHRKVLALIEGKTSFQYCLQHLQPADPSDESKDAANQTVQPDDLILWRQLRQNDANNVNLELCDVGDLQRATGMREGSDAYGVRLSHIYQLSGFADPVYAEAAVIVHDYDIVLEILVINRTTSTLTNLTVELATMGDLKLVERPQSLTLAPLAQHSIRANIKVSSTETGHIFGTIVFEKSSSAEKTYVNLDNIHLDIMDYIRPALCADDAFRHMWAEFEWENKVAIATSITGLEEFLEYIVECTNMRCLTPRSSLGGDSIFLAANLYAKSIFGEDALVNVSVEKKDDADGKLSGYIRIRSKTQGIALSLGDRITMVQRGVPNTSKTPTN